MGIPRHVSRDVPTRCLYLIEELLPSVERLRMPREEHLGPLATTFILSMSIPIITLPIERIGRHRIKAADGWEGYADDRPLDPQMTEAIDEALGDKPIEHSPFYAHGAWRFASIPFIEGHNIAKDFPEELAAGLAAEEAEDNARCLQAWQWAACIRNALAHGGLAYLDKDGRQRPGTPTEMIGFVSARYPRGDLRKPPEALVALRTTRESYLDFLERWVHWLHASGLARELAA